MPIDEDKDFCGTCIEVLKEKYPDEKEFYQILQWHKNHTKLNKQC